MKYDFKTVEAKWQKVWEVVNRLAAADVADLDSA